MKFTHFLFGVLIWLKFHSINSSTTEHHKYCIVGAGPAGLQLGYFFEKSARDYIIFERNDKVGSFFETMPRHGKLISLNKRNTGSSNTEFNFRHDWNSLISDNETMKFRHYSRKMFPHRDDLLRYLNDFYKTFQLKVRFNSDMKNIRRSSVSLYLMEDQLGNKFSCDVLIIATGLQKAVYPNMSGIHYSTGYEEVSIDPEDFEGKNVLILGKGNAAFEVAASIYGNTNVIHLISRDRVRLAWSTHYVGDLRGVNNEVLDSYQLKSLDAIHEYELEENVKIIKDKKGKLYLVENQDDEEEDEKIMKLSREKRHGLLPYDSIIRCLGFEFNDSLINKTDLNVMDIEDDSSKFPEMQTNYASPQYDNLYFAGVLSHTLDYKKSAGGFIHGFRYTARALYRFLDWKYENVHWPHTRLLVNALMNYLMKRVNEASGLYQMYSNLGDIVIFDYDLIYCTYIEEYPIYDIPNFENNTGLEVENRTILIFIFEYGKNFSAPGKDTFSFDRTGSTVYSAYKSNFLHPVFYIYNGLEKFYTHEAFMEDYRLPPPYYLHHMKESLHTSFIDHMTDILPLQRAIENALKIDLTQYSEELCLYFSLTMENLPITCLSPQQKTSCDVNLIK